MLTVKQPDPPPSHRPPQKATDIMGTIYNAMSTAEMSAINVSE